MSLESDIVDLLESSTVVTGLVAGPNGNRIRPFINEEEGDWPAITYSIVDTWDVTDNTSSDGLAFSTVQIDCWASTMASCITLFRAVRAVMLDKTKIALIAKVNAVTPGAGQHDLHEPPTGGSGRPTFRKSLDFTVAYQTPVAA